MLRYLSMDTAARKLPPLAALRVFEAAGRHGSFTGAATELGITPSAVSHGVRTLEDRLGVPLFRRDARGLSLTPAGEDLLAEATSAFDGLARAMQRLTDSHRRAGLRISSAPTFAARWLLPRLPRLRRDHPGVSVTISTEQGWVELGDGRFDLAIRMAEEPSGPGDWHRLVPIALVPVAAPAYEGVALDAVLTRLPAIHVISAKEDWASWSAQQGMEAPDPTRGPRFDTVHMAIDAAAQGLGIALARLPVCNDDLGSGRVVALAQPVETRTSYWLVARPGALRQSNARFFAAWLKRELSGTPVTGR